MAGLRVLSGSMHTADDYEAGLCMLAVVQEDFHDQLDANGEGGSRVRLALTLAPIDVRRHVSGPPAAAPSSTACDRHSDDHRRSGPARQRLGGDAAQSRRGRRRRRDRPVRFRRPAAHRRTRSGCLTEQTGPDRSAHIVHLNLPCSGTRPTARPHGSPHRRQAQPRGWIITANDQPDRAGAAFCARSAVGSPT